MLAGAPCSVTERAISIQQPAKVAIRWLSFAGDVLFLVGYQVFTRSFAVLAFATCGFGVILVVFKWHVYAFARKSWVDSDNIIQLYYYNVNVWYQAFNASVFHEN